ncbi:GntR family transcriptional regulator [Synoicihabitans lomoniglobus]|uniref:GntR family transcriptional regulator n=1 Tax=Synoicihabitans lomoniglobus TaxID=2909285 RepID=A0AAE9ZU17_9BACT|nr:GntR family transcriptional regulator [Opitutaceae bacterium LMO-M01]WED64092.1 GntR family transcriptional regulator [Opitutaceae bacterium LMO-M01]
MNSSKLRHLQIYEKIRSLIQNGSYRAGDMLPTEAQLGVTFGASRPTIAKALNRLGHEKLVRRRAGFGTQVLAPGRSAVTAGLLIPELHQTEIFEPICASITETASIAGMRIIRPPELNLRQERRMLTESLADQFIAAKVQGVFFTPVEFIPDQEAFNVETINRLTSAGIRVVLIDRDVFPWPRQTPHDLIGIDNIEAGYVMGRHLLDNGCGKLAFVSAPDPAMTVQLRRLGCREALIQNGYRANSLTSVDFIPDQPEKTAQQLLTKKVDGVICANDATAAPLLRALLDLGVDIPGALQVVGFDDVKYASLLSVPLTSYRQPCDDIGKVATETMINRIKHPEAPTRRVTLAGQLIPRNSSAGRLPS